MAFTAPELTPIIDYKCFRNIAGSCVYFLHILVKCAIRKGLHVVEHAPINYYTGTEQQCRIS